MTNKTHAAIIEGRGKEYGPRRECHANIGRAWEAILRSYNSNDAIEQIRNAAL